MPNLQTPAVPGRNRPLAHLKTFAAAFTLFSLLAVVWSLASPLMSIPDEPAHSVKAAAVAAGQWTGQESQTQGAPLEVQVPAYIASLHGQPACYIWHPEINAGCSPDLALSGNETVTATTTAGNYNPMYYAVVGLPTRVLDGAEAVYAMRFVSGMLTSFFLAAAFTALASLSRRSWPVLAFAAACTPMVVYLGGSINPTSLEIAACAAVFANLCAVLAAARTPRIPHWNLWLLGVSAAVLANTRAVSMLWLALACLAAVMIFGFGALAAVFRDRLAWVSAVLMAAGGAAALAWLQTSNSFSSLTGQGSDDPPAQVAAVMLDRTFEFAAGYVSYLGWLDTKGPSGVLAIWAAVFGAAILLALSAAPGRARAAVGFLVVCVLALPVVLQIPAAKDVGYIWQGRYILALVVVLVMAAGMALRNVAFPDRPAMRRGLRILLGLLVFGHLYSFIYALRRYTIGLLSRSNWSDMVDAPQWQPPLGWMTVSGIYLALLVLAALLVFRTVNVRTAEAGTENGTKAGTETGMEAGAGAAVVEAGAGPTAAGATTARKAAAGKAAAGKTAAGSTAAK